MRAVRPSRGAASFFVETYGCQMNVSDSEIVQSILLKSGYRAAAAAADADIVLLNTCAVRDNAERRIWTRLRMLRGHGHTVGVLGCMAERLKTRLLEEERLVDVVAGPDSYRDLPRLLGLVREAAGGQAINVQLSQDETYADIAPVRQATNGVSAFVSIMRGCNQMCSYCIVPFTRGRERSRPIASIIDEVRALEAQGFKELTLLGQNVNSYCDRASGLDSDPAQAALSAPGFRTIYKRKEGGLRFTDLLSDVSAAVPGMRIRFTSPHPKDFPLPLLQLINERDNLCKSLHLPLQSGSSSMLERMRRGYSQEDYLELVEQVRAVIPGVSLSTDVIAGFCGETEAEHRDTIRVMEAVRFDRAFMFAYSMREKTHAHRRMADDVPEETKKRRLREVIDTFHAGVAAVNAHEVGRIHDVLIDGESKRSRKRPAGEPKQWSGRTDTDKTVVIDGADLAPGDLVRAEIVEAGTITLVGRVLAP